MMLPPDLTGWERRNSRMTCYTIGAALLSLTCIYGAAWVALKDLT